MGHPADDAVRSRCCGLHTSPWQRVSHIGRFNKNVEFWHTVLSYGIQCWVLTHNVTVTASRVGVLQVGCCDAKSATSCLQGMRLILAGSLFQLVPLANAHDVELVSSERRLQSNGVHGQAGLEIAVETERANEVLQRTIPGKMTVRQVMCFSMSAWRLKLR